MKLLTLTCIMATLAVVSCSSQEDTSQVSHPHREWRRGTPAATPAAAGKADKNYFVDDKKVCYVPPDVKAKGIDFKKKGCKKVVDIHPMTSAPVMRKRAEAKDTSVQENRNMEYQSNQRMTFGEDGYAADRAKETYHRAFHEDEEEASEERLRKLEMGEYPGLESERMRTTKDDRVENRPYAYAKNADIDDLILDAMKPGHWERPSEEEN
ncbi:uncharacterized protein VTP21DRAFT_4398 [Calcarisporiella thermophila]|uniref:uncharacterized protein n=1 Tax=Calcarisporiella thermophila TaxID=911321 RepID=UPI003744A4F1